MLPKPTFSFCRLPLAVVIGLVVAIVLDTLVQLTWKATVSGLPGDVSTMVHTLVGLPSFYLLLVMFAAQFANWMALLARADLSFAQPVTALSYITVAAGSYLRFGEQMSASKVLGIALILVGVFLVGMGSHRAARGEDALLKTGKEVG